MKVGDKVEIIASKKALEGCGIDYLSDNTGVITGFYPDYWIEVEVKTIFCNEYHKVDIPNYFLKLTNPL